MTNEHKDWPGKHADDIAIDKTAAAMKMEMARQRAKGRGGWDDPAQCDVDYLADLLVESLSGGSMIGTCNYAMMLHQRGADLSITMPALARHAMQSRRAALAARPEPAGAPWDYKLMGLPNEEVAEMWRASGHSGVVPFSFANRIQERMQAVQAEPTGAGAESINTQDFKAKLSDYNVGMVSVAGLIAHIDAHVAAQVDAAVRSYANEAEIARLRNEIDKQMSDLSNFDESRVDQTTLALANQAVNALAKRAAPQAQQPVGGVSAAKDAHALWRSGHRGTVYGQDDNGKPVLNTAPAPDAGARDAAPAAVEAIPNELNYWKEIAKDQAELLATLTAQAAPALEDGTLEQLLTRYWDLAFDEGKTGESSGTEAQRTLFAIRHIKSTPAKPAQDLVAAIETIQPDLYSDDSDPTPSYKLGRIEGFREARRHAAALVAAHLKGTT